MRCPRRSAVPRPRRGDDTVNTNVVAIGGCAFALVEAGSYLRRLLVVGMTTLIRRAKAMATSVDPRLPALLQRKPVRVVTVAAANCTARVAWAIMTRGGTCRAPGAAVA